MKSLIVSSSSLNQFSMVKNLGQKCTKCGKSNHSTQNHRPGGNVLWIVDILELSTTSIESINVSCYETSDKVEWFLDSGCMEHVTPEKRDFIEYMEFNHKSKAKITDRKYLKIEGCGTVIGHKYTATYLDNHSSFGVMFYQRTKVKSSQHSKVTKHGPKDNLVPHLNARNLMEVESSFQNVHKREQN